MVCLSGARSGTHIRTNVGVQPFLRLLSRLFFVAFTIQENVPLAPFTVYRIGGPARFFTDARNEEEVRRALVFARERNVPFFLMGGGSNMLVSDKGFDGLVIHMVGDRIEPDGETLRVDAGVKMARAVTAAVEAGLAGFEWGIGIPGTVGGSVRGNAGCFGGEMKDIVGSVDIVDTSCGTARTLSPAACTFGYRHSIFKEHPDWIIMSAVFHLKKGDPDAIQREIQRITRERVAKQDIGTKSAGCIFKNILWERTGTDPERLVHKFPELASFTQKSAIPVSFLIDRAGLKGRRVGSAAVSQAHANFLVNEGEATAGDVRTLIRIIKEEVERKYNLILEEEIQYVGF